MKRTLIALLTVAVIGGILFSGCVALPPEAPVTAPETTPEGTPTPVPTNQNSVLINYERSGIGGLAGIHDELTIYPNGCCELQRTGIERAFTIQPSQLEHLKELMEDANFLDLKVPDLPPPGADVTEDVISYYPEEGRMNTVSAWTNSTPDALRPIVYALRRLVDPNSVLISCERSGGVTGIHDELTIYPNGCCELQRQLPGKGVYRAFIIPPSQLAHLEELMEEANFLDLKVPDLPPPGADFVECVISYYSEEGKMNSVRYASGARPDALEPISIELHQLMEQIYSTTILMSYKRYGGIAGLDDELAIYTDGRCELRRKDVEWEFIIPPSQLAHLKELMEDANFLDLKVPDLPPPGADLIEYVIYYNPEVGKNKTVRVRTTAIPDALQPILNELEQIISSNI